MSDGLAFVCDARGVVRSVLRDDLGLLSQVELPTVFATVLESGSIGKWFALLQEVEKNGSGHGWEVLTRAECPLTLAAAGQNETVIVVGASTMEALSPLLGDLVHIGTEYAELLRRLQSAPRADSEAARWARFTDVTNEMAAMQRELARANRELRRLDAEKNHLLGMVAHDLRSPLQTIALASRALDRDSLEEPQRRLLTAMRNAAEYMTNLVNDALDFAAIESGQVDLVSAPIDLVALVRSVAEIHELSAQQRAVAVEVEAEVPELVLEVDGGKIEQVIANLLSNAIKFSPENGSVEVTVRRADHAEVAVRDHGEGVDPELLPRLFTPFVGRDRKGRQPPGPRSTGLGLAIAQRIAAAHGGEILVDSTPGEGATFTLRLPLPPGAPGASR